MARALAARLDDGKPLMPNRSRRGTVIVLADPNIRSVAWLEVLTPGTRPPPPWTASIRFSQPERTVGAAEPRSQ